MTKDATSTRQDQRAAITRWHGTEIENFHTAQIARQVTDLIQQGRTVIPMHFGQPTAGTSPAAQAAAIQATRDDPIGYVESRALIARIAQHYQTTYGLSVDPARILLTAGASPALVTVFTALFNVGDRVVVGRPGYPAYRNTLKALGREAVEIDLDPVTGYQMTGAMLDSIAAPVQGLVVASPANPTGAVLNRQAFKSLSAVCARRQMTMISDEIYHGITYGERAICALEVNPDAIVINSFSKYYRMPGWRLGWMVVPTDLIARLSAYVINFFITPPTIAQTAALMAFDDHISLDESVAGYRHNRDQLLAALSAIGIREMHCPQGAFYLYIDVSHLTNDSMVFCQRLLQETGISTAPGIDFDPIRGHEFLRLSFALRPDQINQATKGLVTWLKAQPTRSNAPSAKAPAGPSST